MLLSEIECSEDKDRMRVLLEFPKDSNINYYEHFNPSTTLIGEGSWDESKNQLDIVACRFLGMEKSFADAHLGDCSTVLSFRFPAVWSIRGNSSIMGQICSNKTLNEPGYFDRIMFQTSRNYMSKFGSLKYEYSKIDMVRKLCPKSEKTKEKLYPNGYSYNMRFIRHVNEKFKRRNWLGLFFPHLCW